MIKLFGFILCITFAGHLTAQTLPDRYEVRGVAPDDVLNIRMAPFATSEIVGEFPSDTTNVEVLRTQNGWAYVGIGEQSGWVSMAFLSVNPWPENELPRPLSCFGTEPFWNISVTSNDAEYSALADGRRRLTVLRERTADAGFMIDLQESAGVTHTVTINALTCGDGMSDREFGMSTTVFTQTPAGNSILTGCCTLQVN